MPAWVWVLIALVALLLIVAAVLIRARRAGPAPGNRPGDLRELATDLVRLPGRLRRLAGDPRVPRRARWMLIGLAVYVASPIDPIPDVLPGIGQLDEAILVPIILVRIRKMIPPEVWTEHFPPRHRSD